MKYQLRTLLTITLLLLLTACSSGTKVPAEENTTEVNTTVPNDGNTTTAGGDDTSTDGEDDNTSTGSSDSDNATGDDNTPTPPTATLTSLKLTIEKTSLNKDENSTVKVMATYDDNTSEEVTDKVEWVVTPSATVKVTNTTLTALKDTSTTVKAKLDTVTSDAISLNIYWEVNGHTLPPEPDKATNDATLLGVDVNGNDVRDDVERWIYETYKDKHPVHIDIAMQAGRAWQKVLEDPTKAKEIYPVVDAASSCEAYFEVCIDKSSKLFIKDWINTKNFRRKILFNTKERIDAYWQYDKLLSGDTYTIPWCSEKKNLCDFNTSKYEE